MTLTACERRGSFKETMYSKENVTNNQKEIIDIFRETIKKIILEILTLICSMLLVGIWRRVNTGISDGDSQDRNTLSI